MIKLRKLETPAVITKNGPAWTAELLAEESGDAKAVAKLRGRYRHKEIKAALIEETNGKCAYCESKLLHIQHGDIEHIMPKSLAPEKCFDWQNLTLACSKCNQLKSDLDPSAQDIIDPYATDPQPHLSFAGPLVVARTDAGIATRAILDLNRAELSEERLEHLGRFIGILEQLLNEGLSLKARRAILANFEQKEMSSASAYSAMARDCWKDFSRSVDPSIVAGRAGDEAGGD